MMLRKIDAVITDGWANEGSESVYLHDLFIYLFTGRNPLFKNQHNLRFSSIKCTVVSEAQQGVCVCRLRAHCMQMFIMFFLSATMAAINMFCMCFFACHPTHSTRIVCHRARVRSLTSFAKISISMLSTDSYAWTRPCIHIQRFCTIKVFLSIGLPFSLSLPRSIKNRTITTEFVKQENDDNEIMYADFRFISSYNNTTFEYMIRQWHFERQHSQTLIQSQIRSLSVVAFNAASTYTRLHTRRHILSPTKHQCSCERNFVFCFFGRNKTTMNDYEKCHFLLLMQSTKFNFTHPFVSRCLPRRTPNARHTRISQSDH